MQETKDQDYYVIFTKDHTLGRCGYYHGPQRRYDDTPKLFLQKYFAERTLDKIQDTDGLFGCVIKATFVPEKGYGV